MCSNWYEQYDQKGSEEPFVNHHLWDECGSNMFKVGGGGGALGPGPDIDGRKNVWGEKSKRLHLGFLEWLHNDVPSPAPMHSV